MRRLTMPLLLAFIAITIMAATSAFAAEAVVGKIVRLKEAAYVNGKPAQRLGAIRKGDVITTNQDGRVEITFIDDTILTVGGASEFIIDEFSFGGPDSTQKALLKLTKGAFRAVTSAVIDKAPENFVVKTPLATIGIRGTDFWGGFLEADTLDVVMLDGKGVAVTTKGGTVVIDKPGYGLTVPTTDIPPQNLKKWGPAKLGRAVKTVSFE